MGVLNVTPDSFSDGGTLYRFDRLDPDLLLARMSPEKLGGIVTNVTVITIATLTEITHFACHLGHS